MSSTWTIFSHPTPARLCRMTSRRALSESLNICQRNRMDAKDISDKLPFTFKAHFRLVSRCQHVKTLPLIPTPKDSFETSYVSVIASRRVGNGNGRQFSGALVDLEKPIRWMDSFPAVSSPSAESIVLTRLQLQRKVYSQGLWLSVVASAAPLCRGCFQYSKWVKSQIWFWFYAKHLVIPSLDTKEFLKITNMFPPDQKGMWL